jgi:flagellum-specific ATP synthase
MTDVVTTTHRDLAAAAREVLSAYRDAADLIEVGAYVPGSNARVDQALRCVQGLNGFLRQPPDQPCAMTDSLAQLKRVLEGVPHA